MAMLRVLTLIFVACHLVEGGNILLVANPFSLDETPQLIAVGKALVAAKHSIILLAPDIQKPQIQEAKLDHIFYPSENVSAMHNFLVTQAEDRLKHSFKIMPFDLGKDLNDVGELSSLLCHQLLSDTNLMAKIEAAKFDLVLLATSLQYRCLLTIPYKYDIPYVLLSQLDGPWFAGVTGMPSFQPSPYAPHISPSDHMHLHERLHNLVGFFLSFILIPKMDGGSYIEEYAPDKPLITFNELVSKADLYFINNNIYCVDYPRLSAPHYHFLPTLTAQPADPLPTDLEAYMQSSEKGVVFISFGFNKHAKSVTKALLRKINNAVVQLDQNVILHIDRKDKFYVPDNVRVERTVHLNDILGHKKCVLFISHGGSDAQNAAIYHGVPVITIPHSVEQKYNARRLEEHGLGIRLRMHKFTDDQLLAAIQNLISNATYRENVDRCARITRSLPPGTEVINFWIDHILRFGGEHLRPISADMPLYKVLMMDVLALFLVPISTIVIIIVCISCYFCCDHLLTSKRQKTRTRLLSEREKHEKEKKSEKEKKKDK